MTLQRLAGWRQSYKVDEIPRCAGYTSRILQVLDAEFKWQCGLLLIVREELVIKSELSFVSLVGL